MKIIYEGEMIETLVTKVFSEPLKTSTEEAARQAKAIEQKITRSTERHNQWENGSTGRKNELKLFTISKNVSESLQKSLQQDFMEHAAVSK